MTIDRFTETGTARPYTPDDYEAASELLGDIRPLSALDTHIQVSDEGLALWLDPHPESDEAYLGPVITHEREPGLHSYRLVLACAEDALARGHKRAFFTVKDQALLQALQRTFRITPVVTGWDPADGAPREWEVHVELDDAIRQLLDVINALLDGAGLMPQLTVSPVIDSFMDFSSPNTNYGASVTINQGVLIAGGTKTQVRRAIANFDVSAVPPSAVIGAAAMRRSITVPAATQHGIRIARCTRPAQWTEGGVTWNKYDGTNAWVTGGGEYNDITPAAVSFIETNAGGVHDVSGLASFVRDAIDLRGGVVSLLLRNENEAPLVNERSAWLAGTSWQLVIDYNVASEPGRRSSPSGPGRTPARPRSPSTGRHAVQPSRPHEGSR